MDARSTDEYIRQVQKVVGVPGVMTPEEKELYLRNQRISFVAGNILLSKSKSSWPGLSWEEAVALVTEADYQLRKERALMDKSPTLQQIDGMRDELERIRIHFEGYYRVIFGLAGAVVVLITVFASTGWLLLLPLLLILCHVLVSLCWGGVGDYEIGRLSKHQLETMIAHYSGSHSN